MSVRNLLLILTLFFGVALLGFGYLRYGRTPPPATTAPAKMVVIATLPLNAGALIAPQGLAFAPEPPGTTAGTDFDRADAGPGGDQNAVDAATIGKIVGAVARRHIDAGAPIPREAIVKPGDSGFLAAVLQPGMQAITIGVTAVSGAGGLIYPGDRVDVILTQGFLPGANSETHRFGAEIVIRDVRVLAIDQQLQTNASPATGKLAQTVTVEVTPQQAESVVLATKLGDLSLTIRSLLLPSATAPPAVTTGPVWAEDISPALLEVEREEQASQEVKKAPAPVIIIRGSDTPSPAVPVDFAQPDDSSRPIVHTRTETVHSVGGTTVFSEESN